jgi:hypothetical protein
MVFMDNSRSHSMASDISSRLSDSETDIQQLEIISDTILHPMSLTPDQLAMVKSTWHGMTWHDSSNICLNFFNQLHRRFPQMRSKRNLSCSLDPEKQSQLPQHSLKLACCIDKLIWSLFTAHSIEENVIYMLEDYGIIFKAFLGLESLLSDRLIIQEMSNAFTESLRLILIHNWGYSGIRWDDKLNEAWTALFQILLFSLDGIDD